MSTKSEEWMCAYSVPKNRLLNFGIDLGGKLTLSAAKTVSLWTSAAVLVQRPNNFIYKNALALWPETTLQKGKVCRDEGKMGTPMSLS